MNKIQINNVNFVGFNNIRKKSLNYHLFASNIFFLWLSTIYLLFQGKKVIRIQSLRNTGQFLHNKSYPHIIFSFSENSMLRTAVLSYSPSFNGLNSKLLIEYSFAYKLFSIFISLSEVCSKYRGCLLIGPNDKFACDVQGNQRLTSLYNDLLQSWTQLSPGFRPEWRSLFQRYQNMWSHVFGKEFRKHLRRIQFTD